MRQARQEHRVASPHQEPPDKGHVVFKSRKYRTVLEAHGLTEYQTPLQYHENEDNYLES